MNKLRAAVERVTRSDKIRAVLQREPNLSAVQAAKQAGVSVSDTLVYKLRKEMAASNGKPQAMSVNVVVKASSRRKKRRAAESESMDVAALVRRIKDIAALVGGLGRLRELIDVL